MGSDLPRVCFGELKKHAWVEALAEIEANRLSNHSAPAHQLGAAASLRGLVVIEEQLPGYSIGRLDVSRGAIIIDRAKIERLFPGAVEGVVRSTIAHELAHFATHRAALNEGRHNEEMEEQARVYASAFLLPRARLEVDETILALRERAVAGDVPEFYLWSRLAVVAKQFGVTRSLVVERLVRLGFLVRRGRRIWMATPGGAL